jgi:hypothetical protein
LIVWKKIKEHITQVYDKNLFGKLKTRLHSQLLNQSGTNWILWQYKKVYIIATIQKKVHIVHRRKIKHIFIFYFYNLKQNEKSK